MAAVMFAAGFMQPGDNGMNMAGDARVAHLTLNDGQFIKKFAARVERAGSLLCGWVSGDSNVGNTLGGILSHYIDRGGVLTRA